MLEIYQGEDKTIVVTTNDDLSAATEIEFYVDTPTKIKKTLGDGEISGVTSTQFSVAIISGDTETVPPGDYRYQCRATIASKKRNGRFTPNRLKIVKSLMVSDVASVGDY